MRRSGGSGLPSGVRSASRPFQCTPDKVYLALAVATIVWIGGIVAFLGLGGPPGTLEHPTGPHSHNADLRPRGSQAPTTAHQRTDGGRTAGLDLDVDAPSSHGRGFGLSKLENLQKNIQKNLHQIFQHPIIDEEETIDDGLDPTTPTTTTAATGQPTPIPDWLAEALKQDDPLPKSNDDVEIESSDPPTLDLRLTIHPHRNPPGGNMANPAVLILTYQRRKYLMQTLDSIFGTRGIEDYKVYVSQDGNFPPMGDIPIAYAQRGFQITLLNHQRAPLMIADQGPTAYLAQHYKWALDTLFIERGHSHVVIMEDDMVVAPDFFTLFNETSRLLDTDPTLMCVSSWNDNGMARLVANNTRLMRTSYFPGLGWMTNAAIWRELSPQFPLDQWDHFMRLDTTHRGRECIVPEIPRNHNIGEEGTNMGMNFFNKYLAPIALNKVPVSFLRPSQEGSNTLTIEYMRSANYERELEAAMAKARIVGFYGASEVTRILQTHEQAVSPEIESLVIVYERAQFPMLIMPFGLLPVPRSIHKGVLTLRVGRRLVYFADTKTCPYLPEEYRFQRDPTLKTVPAKQDESCTHACQRASIEQGRTFLHSAPSSPQPPNANTAIGDGGVALECSASHFQFINECSQLKAHFPCPKGCRGGVAGQDLPNFVSSPVKQDLYGLCLTTEETPTCDAKHWSTTRLCPCVEQRPRADYLEQQAAIERQRQAYNAAHVAALPAVPSPPPQQPRYPAISHLSQQPPPPPPSPPPPIVAPPQIPQWASRNWAQPPPPPPTPTQPTSASDQSVDHVPVAARRGRQRPHAALMD